MIERRIDINDIPASDVGDPVELYELSLEQVLSTPVQLDAATRQRVRVQDFLENGKFSGATKYISKELGDINYTTIVATALVHGLSIFHHEHDDVIGELQTLNDECLINNYDTYNQLYQSFKPIVNFGKPCKLIWCDSQSHDTINHHAAMLNITLGQLATACLCMSYAESTLLPSYIIQDCTKKVKRFNISCNICLDNLKSLRY